MNTLDIGRFISELRKEKGLTQKELAEKLCLTDKAVSKWETGRSVPDVSILTPLSEILGVSVVEILQGKKIETESFQAVSDEVVVRTIKKDKQKFKRSIFIVVIVMLALTFISVLSYPAYHFFTSVSSDDETAILRQSRQYADVFGETEENMKIVKSVKKGNYFFYLLKSKNNVSMRIFQTDEIFDDRISLVGGGSCSEPNKIEQYCSGTDYTTINVFYGYDMTDGEYSYNYRGVKSTKLIEDKLLLDVLIDIDDSWTHASIIHNK